MIRARLIAAATVIACVVLLAWIAYTAWQNSRTSAARARTSASQAKAVSDSAKDAIDATGAAHARSGASDQLTRENERDIRNAKGADARVDPAVSDAGLGSLCKRPVYSQHPRCVQRAAPERVADTGPRR
jgi:Flp pilus assembly protein TadB